MNLLKKHFKKLKLIATLVWLAVNVIVDGIVIAVASVEIILFGIIITLIIGTMIFIGYLNRLDKIRVVQETQLMEETPLGRMKL